MGATRGQRQHCLWRRTSTSHFAGGWPIIPSALREFFIGAFLPRALTVVLHARHYRLPPQEEITDATDVVEEMDRRWRCRRRIGGKFSHRAAATTSASAGARQPRLGAEGADGQEPQPRRHARHRAVGLARSAREAAAD